MHLYRIACAIVLSLGIAGMALADEASSALSQQIDALINAHLEREKISPSPQADDAEFMRRIYIDLTGYIPAAAEAAAFLDDAQPDKRQRLMEKLLASPRYGTHFADLWCNLIIDEDIVYSYVRQPNVDAFRTWLASEFNRNRPWDQIVREMLAVEGPLDQRPQAVFLELNANPSLTPQPAGKPADRPY